MIPNNVQTNKDKIEYLKAVYGIKGDLFNELMYQIFEDLMTEFIGGESSMNDATYKEMIRLIESTGLGD